MFLGVHFLCFVLAVPTYDVTITSAVLKHASISHSAADSERRPPADSENPFVSSFCEVHGS
jgi:hypothetical protein